MAEQGYRVPEVCNIVGITYRQLDYWARTGLVRPSVKDAKGSGSQRLYSFQDLAMLRLIKRMLDSGVNLQQVRKAMKTLKGLDQPALGTTLVSDGHRIYQVESPRRSSICWRADRGSSRSRSTRYGRTSRGLWPRTPGRRVEAPGRPEARDKGAAAETPALPSDTVSFAHASERQFAQLLDFYQIEWDYEPTSFDLEWDRDGNVVQRFTPDFYLPMYDLYIEITTLNQRLVTKKNRKVRRLRELYPGSTARSSTSATTCPSCPSTGSRTCRGRGPGLSAPSG